MTSLKMAFHQASGRRIVEIYDDKGEFVGAIYPTQDGSNCIHIVSNFFDAAPIAESESVLPVPGYTVKFIKRGD